MEARFFLFFALFQLIHPSISRYLLGCVSFSSFFSFNYKWVKDERMRELNERKKEKDHTLHTTFFSVGFSLNSRFPSLASLSHSIVIKWKAKRKRGVV